MKNLLKITLLTLISIFVTSCKSTKKEIATPDTVVKEKITEKPINKGSLLINDVIKAHGGELYNNASYQFSFRKKKYTFTNTPNSYKYTLKMLTKDKQEVYDVLDNENFTRIVNGTKAVLNKKQTSIYSNALNSVIYFATLPHKLKDKSVNKKYVGNTTIKNKEYNVVEVSFNKEGGGKDFEDIYYYWINTTTNIIDYFAYNYKVNNGGVRFRSAYNKRNIDGIIFQDYINYKATLGTPLGDLPSLFEKNELKEVSRILTEDVINLNKK